MPLTRERNVARAAAMAAGAILLEGWGTRPAARFKSSDFDLVTEFDSRAEACIAEKIMTAFPNDTLLGEEGACRAGTSGRAWHVDPLEAPGQCKYGLMALYQTTDIFS